MFYQNFIRLCGDHGVSRSAVCQAVGLSDNAWRRWESGSTPNGKSLRAISDYFGVEPRDMLRDAPDGDMAARQEMFDNVDMRVLFDAARGIPRSKLYETIAMLNKYKEENGIDP